MLLSCYSLQSTVPGWSSLQDGRTRKGAAPRTTPRVIPAKAARTTVRRGKDFVGRSSTAKSYHMCLYSPMTTLNRLDWSQCRCRTSWQRDEEWLVDRMTMDAVTVLPGRVVYTCTLIVRKVINVKFTGIEVIRRPITVYATSWLITTKTEHPVDSWLNRELAWYYWVTISKLS